MCVRGRVVLEILAETKEPLEFCESEEGRAALRQADADVAALAEQLRALEVQKRVLVKKDRLEEAAAAKLQLDILTAQHAQLKEAARVREEVRESSWQRCLSIAEQILTAPTRSGLSSGYIAGLKDSVILPCIQCPVAARRKRAMLCMGLYCLLSEVTPPTPWPLCFVLK